MTHFKNKNPHMGTGLTKEKLQKTFERMKESIERSSKTPDMYYTNCKKCGQAVTAPCWKKVLECPICSEDFKI